MSENNNKANVGKHQDLTLKLNPHLIANENEITSSKKTADLLANWYQSYYAWNTAYMTSAIINTNFRLTNNSFQNLNGFSSIQPSNTSFNQTFSNQQQQQQTSRQQVLPPAHLVSYKVPSLMKRFLAESFDAIYIQCIKITIALILLNYTNLIDEESFKLFDLIEEILNENSFNNIRLPFELLVLELLYVMTSVAFEAFCLHKKGTTPGKYLFRLKVISCASVSENIANNTLIQVTPGTALSFKSILLRTCLKNFSIIFLFPTIIFFLLPAFADYGQTSYDKAAESIVVQII